MASKFTPPDLSNATPEFLADEMGKLSVVENYVKKLRAFYKEAFLAREDIQLDRMLNGQEKQKSGDIFTIVTVRSDPQRLNTSRLKDEKPEVYNEYLDSKGQLTCRPYLKEGVVNPKVEDLLSQLKQELDLE